MIRLAAIRSLPEAYRETLMLRLVEGLSGPEIAELPNVSAGTRSAGLTFLAKQRLGEIVVENAKRFLTD